jgi:hypothetical protein
VNINHHEGTPLWQQHLATFNDAGVPFRDIADWIERNL